MSKTIKQLAEKFYELVNGDGDLSEVLSDDFVFGIMPGFPYGGDQIGLPASLPERQCIICLHQISL